MLCCILQQDALMQIEAAHGADAFGDSHSWTVMAASKRVNTVGIGLNPHLRRPIGWTIVDEHIASALFLALGENRYMGGQNASSLNHDFALFGASLAVDGQPVVRQGQWVANPSAWKI